MINQLNCKNCAAPLNLKFDRCEYCGTWLNKSSDSFALMQLQMQAKMLQTEYSEMQLSKKQCESAFEQFIGNNTGLILSAGLGMFLINRR